MKDEFKPSRRSLMKSISFDFVLVEKTKNKESFSDNWLLRLIRSARFSVPHRCDIEFVLLAMVEERKEQEGAISSLCTVRAEIKCRSGGLTSRALSSDVSRHHKSRQAQHQKMLSLLFI